MAGIEDSIIEKPKFFNRSSFIVYGTSRSGKTEFVLKLIKHAKDMFQSQKQFKKILYCYSVMQDSFLELEKKFPPETVVLHKNLPSLDYVKGFTKPGIENELLVVIDDLMYEALSSKEISMLFTSGRHMNLTIILITQSLFEKGSYSRTIALNSCYLVLFRNRRDIKQIRRFAQQMYSSADVDKFMSAYKDATTEPYQYLVIDLHSDSDDTTRIRSQIFPDNDEMVLYQID